MLTSFSRHFAAVCALSLALPTMAVASPKKADTTTKQGKPMELAPGKVATYFVTLEANRSVTLTVTGDGEGDLDCEVRDPKSITVTADRSSYDGCELSLNTRETGQYELRIVNNGTRLSRLWVTRP